MKLVESILSRNPCYTAGKKMKVTGLMLHSVGCSQPKASVFINSWNDPSYRNSCVHGFIDGNDGTVYQTLPWDYRGWHCGSGSKGSGNNNYIGVEMCEPACIKYTNGANFTCSDMDAAKAVAKRTYESAVELFAMLCKKFSLDPLVDGVVISHKEGHDRGIASSHGDPEHLWSQLGTGYTMDGFRKEVKKAMNNMGSDKIAGTNFTDEGPETTFDSSANSEVLYRVRQTWTDASSQKGAFKELSNAKACVDENPGYSVFDEAGKKLYPSIPTAFEPFAVRVSTSYLNIRKGPGTDYEKTGKFTGVGVFTVVDVRPGEGADAGWGLLKSYEKNKDGWISLDVAKRV